MSGYKSLKHMRHDKRKKVTNYVKNHRKVSASVVAEKYDVPVHQVTVIKAHIAMGHKI